MSRHFLVAAIAASLFAQSAAAMDGTIMVEDAYAFSASPSAKSGAAFMMLMNHGEEDDRLLSASSGAAQRVELHSSAEDDAGVVRMAPIEDGIDIPAGGSAMLARGGDHVMFMGLNGAFTDGDTVPVTLTFEKAGEITVDIPVDLDRAAGDGHGDHSGHDAN